MSALVAMKPMPLGMYVVIREIKWPTGARTTGLGDSRQMETNPRYFYSRNITLVLYQDNRASLVMDGVLYTSYPSSPLRYSSTSPTHGAEGLEIQLPIEHNATMRSTMSRLLGPLVLLVITLLIIPSVMADSAGCGKTPTLTSGSKTMTVNGKNRRWMIRLPDRYDNKTPYKVIFGLHWRDADYMAVDGGTAPYYGLRALANNSVIFVAPDGLNKGWGNAGGEDVTFIDNVLKAVTDDLCVNEKLVFSLGFSYGAAMSFSLACARPKAIRAIAVLSGAMLSGCQGGTEPVVRASLCPRLSSAPSSRLIGANLDCAGILRSARST